MRPVVLPEPFSGKSSYDEWAIHFENVADVNGWTDEQKLKWLRVRLIGRAQKAFLCLLEDARTTYGAAQKALSDRFEPASQKTRYQAEFQSRKKKPSEGWADFADDLQALVDKAYPSLQPEARESLALNSYLQQLSHPQVAFRVWQTCPESLDAAVTATLEMESYTVSSGHMSTVSTLGHEKEQITIAAIDPVTKLTRIVERLSEQVEVLQIESARAMRPPVEGSRNRHSNRQEPDY